MHLCPCTSQNSYEHCCKPFHDGLWPENALLLMRSRYSAFALNKVDYIVETTHPASPHYSENKFSWKRRISQFSKDTSFERLHILDFKEHPPFATVTFTAYLKQGERDTTFTERSFFEKFGGRWLYRGGQTAAGHVPNLVTNERLKILPLAYYGDPVLRQKTQPITEITDEIRDLVEEMVETMDVCDGIGLAAPQVQRSLQLFIVRTPIEKEKDKYDFGEVEIFINPILLDMSVESCRLPESCLSIPGISGEIERPLTITAEYTSLDNHRVRKAFTGYHARIILHENDHIDGTLFVDRLSREE